MSEKEIPESLVGSRLDDALLLFFPEMGLRGRRRAIADGRALVNGNPCRAGQKLKKGDRLAILPLPASTAPEPLFIGEKNNIYVFDKPPGLHTQELAGREGSSLEGWIKSALTLGRGKTPPKLLQRLDFRSSGLIIGSDDSFCEKFRRMENRGSCRKYYLTILTGELKTPAIASRALDIDNRRATRILSGQAEPLHITAFTPLGSFSKADGIRTVAICEIKKGLRHQIRAHAASIGHPLYGDGKYGEAPEESFYLRHFCLETPEFQIFHYPGDLPDKDMEKFFLEFVREKNFQTTLF
ncbi:MAG: hypothetical protein HDQ93_06770 [Desulfovibrio sp.]|nr:hypothetical protein [Desulfovibrio sp.]